MNDQVKQELEKMLPHIEPPLTKRQYHAIQAIVSFCLWGVRFDVSQFTELLKDNTIK